MKNIDGKVAWVFDEPNFDIDLMIGVENISITDPEKLKAVFMKEYEKKIIKHVNPGDVIVGGKNFGYGHPHMGAKTAMTALGMSAIIAESFAPICARVDRTFAFVDIVCPNITKKVSRGDHITFDWEEEVVINHTTGEKIPCEPIPQKTKEILECGGVVEYIRKYRL